MTDNTTERVARLQEAAENILGWCRNIQREESFDGGEFDEDVAFLSLALGNMADDAAMGQSVVKPLEWLDSYGVIRADTEFGSYQISANGKVLTLGVAPLSPQKVCANLDDAKAAAEADHERRVLSRLTTAPAMDVQQAARVLLDYMPNYAMEKAALESKAVDDEGEFQSLSDLLDFSGQNKSYTVVREALCAALRALANQDAGEA